MERTSQARAIFAATLTGLVLLALGLSARSTTPVEASALSLPPALDQPDLACRNCHEKIYDSYQHTAMARGSGLATDQQDVQLFGKRGFLHEPSGITYRIALREGQAFLSYSRPESQTRPALAGERRLDYFIGSGTRGRTYLYQVDNLLFEAPINWYGKKRIWDMAPAYENVSSMPDPLPVDANCLHCHAGNVQAATGGVRNRFDGPPFRSAGIGCAACHGDPTAHLASAGHVKAGLGPVLNPDKLSPRKRDSICLQCHLEGDATVYLPGKSLAAFLPGQDLAESALYFIDATRAHAGGRASSQYEALVRSACKRASGDRLTCTTCHDPHSSPAPTDRVAFFRARCLACHNTPAMASTHHPEQPDCASCHMPTRKTLDISHEQLTDHDIEARPDTTPLRSAYMHTPELVPVFTPAAGISEVGSRELGLAYAQLAQHGSRAAGELALGLMRQARQSGSDDPELHDQLGYLLQLSGSPTGAAAEYAAALRQRPEDTTATANLAVLDATGGHVAEAIRLLQQTVSENPAQIAAGLNLAFLECRAGHKPEAIQTVQQALRFSPDSPSAHAFLEKGTYGGQTCQLR